MATDDDLRCPLHRRAGAFATVHALIVHCQQYD
eukprot:CAMPEP_0198313418 /NCGR_PEP_ID=MMETSP1450-20131203/4441_1 /TAXON_ID=753684 ORGANISM="Madagascaria erythrocladiodes, Strain CCMP3234" /NCGR_SAMPLE_ID=MMETSP1450 /ASSEMBLY_ACC=CAM_ASM_001115 /LENGTH=32 /DNA_ID= /DNA_START= /DNA_END= /DNA_ORIENTATION=